MRFLLAYHKDLAYCGGDGCAPRPAESRHAPPEALKALIHAQYQTLTVQAEEIRAQRERLHSQDEQLAGRQAEIERLQLLIAKLRGMQFGRRRRS